MHAVDIHVGQRIRQRRWMLGMTQKQLASTSGVKFQQIQKYETGANRVSASRLWEFAEELQVPISYFFEGLDEAGAPTNESDLNSTKEAASLVRVFYSIPEAQRKPLLTFAQSLAQPRDAE
ncbi:Xre family transcriptional regulator [Roseinatronobacter monicus]|uniref:Xre family transcriptional regulator n=2 Tax=Roseinatronobacter monicus TaxID=393481 RepID=A0A543K3Y8_9RHOB|nr:Xre family transcriptional regulator [Roseinatronobacter monicus]